jgi:hypothetical protein
MGHSMLGQPSSHCQSGEISPPAARGRCQGEIVLCFALREFRRELGLIDCLGGTRVPRNQPGRATSPFGSTAEFDPRGGRLSPASGTVMPETQVRDGGNGHARTQTARTG